METQYPVYNDYEDGIIFTSLESTLVIINVYHLTFLIMYR